MSVQEQLKGFNWKQSMIFITSLHLVYYVVIITLTTTIANWQPIWFVFPILNLLVFFAFDAKIPVHEISKSNDRNILRRLFVGISIAMTITMALASLGSVVIIYGLLAAVIVDITVATVIDDGE